MMLGCLAESGLLWAALLVIERAASRAMTKILRKTRRVFVELFADCAVIRKDFGLGKLGWYIESEDFVGTSGAKNPEGAFGNLLAGGDVNEELNLSCVQ